MSRKNEKVLFTHAEDEMLIENVAKHPSLYDLSSELYKDQRIKENAWKEVEENIGRTAADCKKRWKNIKDTYRRRKKTKMPTGSSADSKPKKWALEPMLCFLEKVDHKRPSIANIGSEADKSDEEEQHDINDDDDDDISHHNSEKSIAAADEINVSQSTTENNSTTQERSTDTINLMSGKGRKRPTDTASLHTPNKRQKFRDTITTLLSDRSAEREKLFKQMENQGEDAVDVFFRSMAMTVKQFHPSLIAEAKMKTLQVITALEVRSSNLSIEIPERSSSATSSSFPSPISYCNNSPSPASIPPYPPSNPNEMSEHIYGIYGSNAEYHNFI